MHVLALVDYVGNVGGAELSARTVVTELAEADGVDRVTVVGADPPGAERLDYPGVAIRPVGLPGAVDRLPDLVADRIVARLLAREARTVAADVVHAHHRRSALALAHLKESAPAAATVRDYWPICPISVYSVDCEQCTGCGDRLDDCVAYQGWDGPAEPAIKQYLLAKRRYNRRGLDGADAAVFIADHLRETVGAALPLPPRVERIYNPVTVPLEPATGPPADPRFVTASSLTREKGVATAVRAVGAVEGATLDVFGDGPLADELEALAADVAPGAVTFHGRVPPERVYEAMRSATATVFPSLWAEPFGRVTVESMALGTPVVGSAVGGIAEVVDDGETGLLYPPDDHGALAERLHRLEDPERWRRLSAAGVEAARQFRPAAIAERHVDLYKKLIEINGNNKFPFSL